MVKKNIWIFDIFLYLGGDQDHSYNLMVSKLDQDPSPNFLS